MDNKLQPTSHERRATSDESSAGSALILTVVLTSMLAIIGVLFVLVGRLDNIAAVAKSQNEELNSAVETVVAGISRRLVLDVPGAAGQEYYDYPDSNNLWLACLEPYDADPDPLVVDPYWRRISDIYDVLDANNLEADIVDDYQAGIAPGLEADADGDGVADSRWVIVPDITSSKGKFIYAAVRVIDNGGMLNVNTAYKFNPNDTEPNINGSSQMQIDLMALAGRDNTHVTYPEEKEDRLWSFRCGIEPNEISTYEQNVVWRYYNPDGAYTPFDIGDELKLRNRYILNYNKITTRIEKLWTNAYDGEPEVPRNKKYYSINDPCDWFWYANNSSWDPNIYDYRHISTTYNMDRIIGPDGAKMVNVNRASAEDLNDVLLKTISDDPLAAQLAVNIKDFCDDDADVTILDVNGINYYGFEAQPFISEIGFRIDGEDADDSDKNFFALELYNPFEVDIPLDDFTLELRPGTGRIRLTGYTILAKERFVITNNSDASSEFGVSNMENSDLVLATYTQTSFPPNPIDFTNDRYDIYLMRRVPGGDIYLDKDVTDVNWFTWSDINEQNRFYRRFDENWNIVYQGLERDYSDTGTLGQVNNCGGPGKNYNIPTFTGGFVTVGDIARVLTIGPSIDPNDMIGEQLEGEPSEGLVRLDLQKNTAYQQIFNYLTVFDPNEPRYGGHFATETRVKGRININTAPWFVLAQLPWVSQRIGYDNPALAQAIVAYRDNLDLSGIGGPDYSGRGVTGFKGIGELNNVHSLGDPDFSIDYYARDPNDLLTFPDLKPGDNAIYDFEERDVIFSRISNLVTVRSDVFTAYILVRIGENGPQKRVVAILDRSNVYSSGGKVRIISLHPVPDPR